MTINIMLDLETWGTKPGCDIRSIGACVFWPDSIGECVAREGPKTFYIACDNPKPPSYIHSTMVPALMPAQVDGIDYYWDKVSAFRLYHLQRDPRTVQWWNDQSDEARAAFADPVELREALIQFGEWLQAVRGTPHQYSMSFKPSDDIRLWSHGSHFDVPILAAAYEAVGLPVPWHYRAPRDTRTIFDAAEIEDHSAWLDEHPGPLGIPHHALDDAICQARAVCGAYDKLAGPKEGQP